MRLPLAVSLAFLAAAPAAAQPAGPPAKPLAARSVDLSSQFPDDPKRDQSVIGDCHAFASVAVLEAAAFRALGEHTRLAEEDLFLQKTLATGDAYQQPCAGESADCSLTEGNWVDGDIRHALEHGVMTGSNYQAFVERYKVHRVAESNVRKAIAWSRENPVGGEGGGPARGDGAPAAGRAGPGGPKAPALEGALIRADPERSWQELFSDPGVRRELDAALLGDPEVPASQRAAIKKIFAGMRLASRHFEWFESKGLTPKGCLGLGADRARAIKGELDAGRPVAVSMLLTGLKAWGMTEKDRDAYHAFAITGYFAGKDGLLRFKTRNSWAGVNPPVREDEACRINHVDSVLVSGETESFSPSAFDSQGRPAEARTPANSAAQSSP
jgi:hypothetical protein